MDFLFLQSELPKLLGEDLHLLLEDLDLADRSLPTRHLRHRSLLRAETWLDSELVEDGMG